MRTGCILINHPSLVCPSCTLAKPSFSSTSSLILTCSNLSASWFPSSSRCGWASAGAPPRPRPRPLPPRKDVLPRYPKREVPRPPLLKELLPLAMAKIQDKKRKGAKKRRRVMRTLQTLNESRLPIVTGRVSVTDAICHITVSHIFRVAITGAAFWHGGLGRINQERSRG